MEDLKHSLTKPPLRKLRELSLTSITEENTQRGLALVVPAKADSSQMMQVNESDVTFKHTVT